VVTVAAESQKPARRGNRRVTAPGTSGQTEEQEADVHDPLKGTADTRRDHQYDARGDWLKAERPPHW